MRSEKIHIIVIGGIRTHFIKINAIQKIVSTFPSELKSKFFIEYINVAQHYDFPLTCFIEELGVHFDYTLKHSSHNNYDILSSIFCQLGNLFDSIQYSRKIDYVIVMGDVGTTIVSAIVSSIKGIKVIHIESGVRVKKGNGQEEYYRIATDHLSTLCFASTRNDYTNLRLEKINNSYFSGDIIFDYIKYIENSIKNESFFYLKEKGEIEFDINQGDYILSSLHHVENLDENVLQNIFDFLHNSRFRSIFIAHPRVKKILKQKNINTYSTIVADGISYLNNLKAIKNCVFCITDSGGIQREAFYFNKRCLVRSDFTIWKSIIDIGSNLVVGKSLPQMKEGMKWVLRHLEDTFNTEELFGNGDAVAKIFREIERHFYETK